MRVRRPQLARLISMLALAGAGAFAAPSNSSSTASPRVRFHHYHFRVPDPAAAMNYGATALEGTRVLLRGLGVGMRVGTAYALFDRLQPSDLTLPPRPILDADVLTRQWLTAHGVDVDPDTTGTRGRLADLFRSEALDHIGFTTADTSAVVAVLRAHLATPIRETGDSSLYHIDGGVGVEIVRDSDAPDAFWCPMHPDIRSSDLGKCPLCGMSLVPIPPPRLGEYRMDVSVRPARGRPGASGLRLTFHDPITGAPAGRFATIHERQLHLFVIDRSLEYFRHVHPAKVGDGVFDLALDMPPGEYVVIADFLPEEGRAQMLQLAIVTPGYHGPLFRSTELSPDLSQPKLEGGTRVGLDAPGLLAGKEALLTFTLADAATGAPVSDLEPFLGAPGHVLIVNADLTEADHVHPEEAATSGPVITFQPRLPAAGTYKLWLQFQRHGTVVTIPFVLSVGSR